MRAVAMDRRILVPSANRWDLYGDAYVDGDELVLPTLGSRIEYIFYLGQRVQSIRWRPMAYIPLDTSQDRLYTGYSYYDSNMESLAATSNVAGNATINEGLSGMMTRWGPVNTKPGTHISYMKYRITIHQNYGGEGTRFLPEQGLMEITYREY